VALQWARHTPQQQHQKLLPLHVAWWWWRQGNMGVWPHGEHTSTAALCCAPATTPQPWQQHA
jgi:hypothetical protein